MMKRTIILGFSVVIVAIAGGVFLWSGFRNRPTPVDTAELKLAPLERSIDTNGTVEAEEAYELHAPVSGICGEIVAVEGTAMKAGQPILRIADPSLESDLAAARAELESAQVDLRNVRRGPSPEELNQAEADVARYRLELDNARKIVETNEWLSARNAIPRNEVEQSRRQLELSQHTLDAAVARKDYLVKRYDEVDRRRAFYRVEAAEARMKYLEGSTARLVIRAPYDGSLYHFKIKTGAFISTGNLIGLFADLSRLRVRAYVDEPDLGRVSVGTQVIIRWDAHSGESWRGTVRYIPPEVVEYRSRSVAEVLCSIDEPPRQLIPNVNVDVEILQPQGPKVYSLPRSSVLPGEKGNYVWVVRNGRAARQAVQAGISTLSRIEVTGGLSPADVIIVPGEVPITDGMRVQVSKK